MDRLYVATLNLRNLADRWADRQSLVYTDMAALQPDVLALQEVVYPLQQDRLIGASGEGRYESFRGWAARPEYGNALLVRAPLVGTGIERLDLGRGRSAHRARIALPGGTGVVVAVTHLHHPPAAAAERDEQASALIDWLAAAPARDPAVTDGTIVMGDFNAPPNEPTYARMRAAGFRSAHFEANGREPAVTWPSGLQAPAIDTDGDPNCLDYIWVRGAIRIADCRVVFDRPAADDPTLYPSDHFGLAAHLEVGR
ncbi:MAG: endonuclease/exonuclease/phosphatase family protein [Candidatus Limnocylindrales bacterium]